MINNNKELWEAMMGGPVEITEEDAKAAVTKAVFKYSKCGCSFTSDNAGVSLAGYAEGSDAELPIHILFWGFTYDDWTAAMAEADSEGVEEWHLANPEGL